MKIPNLPTTNAGLALNKLEESLKLLKDTGDAWSFKKAELLAIIADFERLTNEKSQVCNVLSDDPLRSTMDGDVRKSARNFHADVMSLYDLMWSSEATTIDDQASFVIPNATTPLSVSPMKKLQWMKRGTLKDRIALLRRKRDQILPRLRAYVSDHDPDADGAPLPEPSGLNDSESIERPQISDATIDTHEHLASSKLERTFRVVNDTNPSQNRDSISTQFSSTSTSPPPYPQLDRGIANLNDDCQSQDSELGALVSSRCGSVEDTTDSGAGAEPSRAAPIPHSHQREQNVQLRMSVMSSTTYATAPSTLASEGSIRSLSSIPSLDD
ncbi:hypothetical protein MIND_00964500 [Mycena indigotica]|uniref:Uncharacterized protein n=1 Tax=Mycena indigotica TaxID=2126181 RepID=A0A8H6SFA5_9AGAR|nr:uncharacterized protein MIND_00964500 [Mycena indigotica]KAF7297312.1 hypothetical protein MIND_00964500 [Mycena indigotica]